MAVFRNPTESEWHSLMWERRFRQGSCFYCYEPLRLPFVYWDGCPLGDDEGGLVAFHPGCVMELSIRLFHDVHQVELEGHNYVTFDANAVRRQA